jgi:hypothetical protein
MNKIRFLPVLPILMVFGLTGCLGGGVSASSSVSTISSEASISSEITISSSTSSNISISSSLSSSVQISSSSVAISSSSIASSISSASDSSEANVSSSASSEVVVSVNEFSVNLDPHPDNTLMALLSVTSDNPAKVTVNYGISGSGNLNRQMTSPDFGLQQDFTLIAMRANTTYEVSVTLDLESGVSQLAPSQTITTGNLPPSAPTIVLEVSEEAQTGGITLFGIGTASRPNVTAPVYFGVDEEGQIVWYLHNNRHTVGIPIIRRTASGNLNLVINKTLEDVTSAGRVLAAHDFSQIQGSHHDQVLLPDGNIIGMGERLVQVGNQQLLADTLVEIDGTTGAALWEWNSADYLDTGRFPSALATSVVRGGLDWTHGNGMYYDATDNTILASYRSQSWVVKVDRATREVIWILGNSNNLSPGFTGNFFSLAEGTWMANEHAPDVAANGDILVYDNRNDANGANINSRAVRYALDTETMTATQVWEVVAPKYTAILGDIDELDNGNYLVCSGGSGSDGNARVFEAAKENNQQILWQISVLNTLLFRAERVDWQEFLNSSMQ